MRYFLNIFLCLFIGAGANAQIRFTDTREIPEQLRYSVEKPFNTWAISAGYGSFFMYSDISDYSVFPTSKVKFGPSLTISKQLLPVVAIDFKVLMGDMYGQFDKYYFEGDLIDVSASGVLFINQLGAKPGPINDRWNFYVTAGVGAVFFRSVMRFKDTDEIVTTPEFNLPGEHFMVSGYDKYDATVQTSRQSEIIVPIGGGVMYRVNNHIDLGLETSMRFSASDNLDNILTGSSNDRYLYTALNVSYKIGKKDKPHMRWTYRGLGFNLFGRPRKDMLADEIRLLEDAIRNVSDVNIVRKDSVVIGNSLTTLYQTVNINSIFFPAGGEVAFNDEDKVIMAEMVVKMMQMPGRELELYGYVDSGDSGDHEKLSIKQCEAIKDFLVNELGADANRIKIFARGSRESFGQTQFSSAGYRKIANRRVDLVFRR